MWVGKLVARWRAGGWDAVEKQSTRPKSNPHAAPAATIEAVLALRAQLTAQGLDAGPHTPWLRIWNARDCLRRR